MKFNKLSGSDKNKKLKLGKKAGKISFNLEQRNVNISDFNETQTQYSNDELDLIMDE